MPPTAAAMPLPWGEDGGLAGSNAFVVDLVKEQQEEIKRMTALLGTVSEDPRTALAAGTNKAGQAIRGSVRRVIV